MPLTVSFPLARSVDLGHKKPRFSIIFAVTLVCCIAPAWGQAPPLAENPPVKAKSVVTSGPLWSELSPNQQRILAPLAPSWGTLEPVRKRKWISMARTYTQLTPVEQAKLQSRMAEWAALSPHQRAVARLNFSESKKLPASDLAANWDAYKALPPEDRQKFVSEAASAPKSAALAPKRSTSDKVTPVPLTRRTLSEDRANAGVVTPSIDSKTLLPQTSNPAKTAVSSPAD